MNVPDPYERMAATVGDIRAATSTLECIEYRMLVAIAEDQRLCERGGGAPRAQLQAAASELEISGLRFLTSCFGAGVALSVERAIDLARTEGDRAVRRALSDYRPGWNSGA